LDNPVIAAAIDWLQSSLAIEQSKTLAPPVVSPPQPTESV
jgi:hypothetical protein